MKKSLSLLCLAALVLSGCVGSPYYGNPVVKSAQGDLICGLHQSPVTAHKGYCFNGCMSPAPPIYFADQRFPNTLGPGFSKKRDDEFGYTLPFTDYTCAKCIEEHERLKKLPMWYKRLVGWPAEMRRELQLERAAAKAVKTGNMDDARLQDGDGWISRVR